MWGQTHEDKKIKKLLCPASINSRLNEIDTNTERISVIVITYGIRWEKLMKITYIKNLKK